MVEVFLLGLKCRLRQKVLWTSGLASLHSPLDYFPKSRRANYSPSHVTSPHSSRFTQISICNSALLDDKKLAVRFEDRKVEFLSKLRRSLGAKKVF